MCTCAGSGRSDSRTAVVGITNRSAPTPTSRPSSTASVSGSVIRNVVPLPGSVRISIRPRSASMLRRTTSMPTPRPEISVTLSAVEKPGSKISTLISSADGVRAGRDQAALDRLRHDLARCRGPAPSSAISMTMCPPWW